MQSPENEEFFLGTTRTLKLLPTFFVIYITLFGHLCTEWAVNIVPELIFLAYLYQMKEKIIQNVPISLAKYQIFLLLI